MTCQHTSKQGGAEGPTLVNLRVLLRHVGVGPPDHHLADIRGVPCSRDEGCYPPIAPPQQRDILKLQRLWQTQQNSMVRAPREPEIDNAWG